MENKKRAFIFIILLLVIIIGGFMAVKSLKKEDSGSLQADEYTPQEEISNSQARQTIVSLYFQNKENGELVPEARLIDIKDLMNFPVEKLVNLLIEGPKNSNLERILPENVKLEKNYMDGDVAVLEFSSPLLENNESDTDEKLKSNLLESIKKTLTQLNEINDIYVQGLSQK